ncbi:MAG: ankyrin repeat domain-containing protein [Akkermansia sp.]|nr:ankyrin repeat domain-containing protein [Akkermansia sp.]
MSDIQWNSVTVSEEEKPRVSLEDLREMAVDFDPDDFDEPVQAFLDELMVAEDMTDLRRAATLLLQDEVDFSPELAAMGVEPDVALISLLLATGADVNVTNPYGQTPLHLAAQYGYEQIVDMLLAAGAKLTVRNRDGKFPADLAQDAELKARLSPPSPFDDDMPLPPEIEDADYVPPHEHGHDCNCGHCHGSCEE